MKYVENEISYILQFLKNKQFNICYLLSYYFYPLIFVII